MQHSQELDTAVSSVLQRLPLHDGSAGDWQAIQSALPAVHLPHAEEARHLYGSRGIVPQIRIRIRIAAYASP